jgi:GT2 family glycosyltransferase
MYAEDDEWCLRVARANWSLVFEPNAEVMHHGGYGALERWSSEERRLTIVEEGLRFQRYCLSRRRLISNLLANSLVVLLAHMWKSLMGGQTNETGMKLGLYLKHLKQAFSWRK